MITVPLAAIALLYTRMDTPSILAHGARRRVVEAVRRRPGVNLRELSEELGVDPKTIDYHVRCLQRVGHVRVERIGAALRCFPPGARVHLPPSAVEEEALAWVELGARGPADLARAMRIPRGTAGRLLERLARRGLVERGETGVRPAAKEAFSPGRGLGGA